MCANHDPDGARDDYIPGVDLKLVTCLLDWLFFSSSSFFNYGQVSHRLRVIFAKT